jgi:hypothetical protein
MITRTKVEKIVGKTFADELDKPVFKAYNWEITKRRMVDDIGCGNFIAAARLSKVLRRLKVSTPSQLFKLDPASLARVRGIGESSIFVALCILDFAQYNIEEWWDTERKFRTVKITKASKNGHEV